MTVTLTNNLPVAAGNTSIVFPGQQVTATGGVAGLLTNEAQPGGTVTYAFTRNWTGHLPVPQRHAHRSANRNGYVRRADRASQQQHRLHQRHFSLAGSAYNDVAGAAVNPTCYDREYLFVLSEMQIEIHQAVETQASGRGTHRCGDGALHARILDDQRPRSAKHDGAPELGAMPHQPYNSMPRMHPGDKVLLRVDRCWT